MPLRIRSRSRFATFYFLLLYTHRVLSKREDASRLSCCAFPFGAVAIDFPACCCCRDFCALTLRRLADAVMANRRESAGVLFARRSAALLPFEPCRSINPATGLLERSLWLAFMAALALTSSSLVVNRVLPRLRDVAASFCACIIRFADGRLCWHGDGMGFAWQWSTSTPTCPAPWGGTGIHPPRLLPLGAASLSRLRALSRLVERRGGEMRPTLVSLRGGGLDDSQPLWSR